MAWKDVNPEIGDNLTRLRGEREVKHKALEEQMRKIITERLEPMDREIEDAVKSMYKNGSTIAEILRFYGTSNYRTVKSLIDKD